MPNERFAMGHMREVLRLESVGIPIREIARRLGAVPSTVRLTLKRAASAGLYWPLGEGLNDEALERLLFAGTGSKKSYWRQMAPDWLLIHRELKHHKLMTLQILRGQ